jgi:hypothetical protein
MPTYNVILQQFEKQNTPLFRDGVFFCRLETATTKTLSAVAVAVAAVHRTVSRGLERKFLNLDSAVGALKVHSRDIHHGTRGKTSTLAKGHSSCFLNPQAADAAFGKIKRPLSV